MHQRWSCMEPWLASTWFITSQCWLTKHIWDLPHVCLYYPSCLPSCTKRSANLINWMQRSHRSTTRRRPSKQLKADAPTGKRYQVQLPNTLKCMATDHFPRYGEAEVVKEIFDPPLSFSSSHNIPILPWTRVTSGDLLLQSNSTIFFAPSPASTTIYV